MSIQWNRRSYTEAEFREAWKNSTSIADCARFLNLSRFGATYHTLKDTAIKLGLTQEHFRLAEWRPKTPISTSKKPLEHYLVEGKKTNSQNLKSRLIKEGLLAEVCSAPYCPIPNPTVNPFTGEEKPLLLCLDHINGNHADNRLENLRLLCYHCHGETETYAGSNMKAGTSNAGAKKKSTLNKQRGFILPPAPKWYCECGNPRSFKAKTCRDCYLAIGGSGHKSRIIFTAEEILAKRDAGQTLREIGMETGVTGDAIRHYLNRSAKLLGDNNDL